LDRKQRDNGAGLFCGDGGTAGVVAGCQLSVVS
jgi:hypothetical protein